MRDVIQAEMESRRRADSGFPRLLVVGDVMLDRYLTGDIERINPEAPVPLIRVQEREVRLGGAASVAMQLRGLGGAVGLVGVVGGDRDGQTLRQLVVEDGISDAALLVDPDRTTTVKERVMGRTGSRHGQQILRIDHEDIAPLGRDVEKLLLERVAEMIGESDAVLVSDYGKGVCTKAVLRDVVSLAENRGIPVAIDPARGVDVECYAGADVLTPNRVETHRAAGMAVTTIDEAFEAGQRILDRCGYKNIVVTLDREGMVLVNRDGMRRHFPTRVREVCDVSGAGDTVLAVIGWKLATGQTLAESLPLANAAAGWQVEQLGVARLSWADIECERPRAQRSEKIIDVEQLPSIVNHHRRNGRTIVFTNGCFDLLHVGHLRCLQEAAQFGDVLIVAINCDDVVTRLKGPSRPIVNQHGRAVMLSALACVDHVLIFEDPTPHQLLRQIRPEILVKGGTTANVVGEEVVMAYGGQVVLTTTVPGASTTAMLESIQEIPSRMS